MLILREEQTKNADRSKDSSDVKREMKNSKSRVHRL